MSRSRSPWRRMAGALADSPLLRRGRRLWEANRRDHGLSHRMSAIDKLFAGGWLILRDWSDGVFPVRPTGQDAAYAAEIGSRRSDPARGEEAVAASARRKPFWSARSLGMYLPDFVRIVRMLEACALRPPSRILEIGCGSGWMTEFFSRMGYAVLGTTLAEHDVTDANRLAAAAALRDSSVQLEFRRAPMETVHEHVADAGPFDAVVVYEALHHAYDWRAAIRSAGRCLRPGGWFLVCGEPNVIHNLVAYRVARLTGTCERGFWGGTLRRELRAAGFGALRSFRRGPGCGARHHWIAARREEAK